MTDDKLLAVSKALAEALQAHVDHFGDPLKVALPALAAYREALAPDQESSGRRE